MFNVTGSITAMTFICKVTIVNKLVDGTMISYEEFEIIINIIY